MKMVLTAVLAALAFAGAALGQTKNVALSTTVKWDGYNCVDFTQPGACDTTSVSGKVVLSRFEPCIDPTATSCYVQLALKTLSSAGGASFTLSGEKTAVYRVDLFLADGTLLASGVFSFAVLDDAQWSKLASVRLNPLFRLADRSKKQEQFTLKYAP